MKSWISLSLLLLISSAASAGSALLTCTAPTENEDGSTLTDLAGFKFYYGVAPGTYTDVFSVDSPDVCGATIESLTEGLTYYFVATAFNEGGVESVYSNEAIKTIGYIAPSPPTMLVAELEVFSSIKRLNRYVLLKIGTVPVGTSCDPTQSVNGHNVVDLALVDWDDDSPGAIRPVVVVAKCI